jgi:DME family drug/metabolite transporter
MIGELAALGAAISWTVSAMLYRKALQRTKPISANIIRLSCTSAILLVLLVSVGKFGVLASMPLEVVALAGVSGVIGLGLGDTLYMTSLRLIGVARAVPLACVYPLFNLLWAILLIGEPVTLQVALGALVIVVGIWFLSYEKKTSLAETQKRTVLKGVVAALVASLLWSISIATMDIAVAETPDFDHALVVNTVRVAMIACLLLVSSPVIDRERDFLKADRRTVATLIAGGVVALGLGWFLLTYSFVLTLESRAVPISSTTPLFSTLAGVALLREKVSAKNVAGAIIIVVGISLIFLV